jgi:hypothetical protein
VDNVLDDVVEELGVVRDDDGCAGGGDEVVLEPCNVLDVQVVGGLVEKKNIGLLEDGTGKSQLHLPTTGETTDGAIELLLEETELNKSRADLSIRSLDTDSSKLLHGPANNGLLSVVRVEIVLDVDGLDLILLGETLNLLVVDSTHKGGLSGTVGAKKTVTLTTLQAEMGLVEQDLGTVGQVEGAVAEILTLLLIGLDIAAGGGERRGVLAELLSNVASLSVTDDDGKEGNNVLGPNHGLNDLLVDELTTNSTNVVDNGLELGSLVTEDGLEVGSNGSQITILGNLRSLAVLDVTNTAQGVKSLLGLLTSLGVSEVVVVVVKSGHQLGQERSDNLGILDKLAHVVDNDGRLSLDGGLTLVKTTLEKGNHDSEGGLVDVGDESGGTEQMNGLGDVLGLSDTLDELGNETVDILVDDQRADLLHGGVGSLLDLVLGVPHGLGDDGDQLRNTESGLDGRGLGESDNALKIGHLLLPLLCVVDGLDEVRDEGLDGVGIGHTGDGEGGGLGGVLDGNNLVTDGVQDGGEKVDEVRLNSGADLRVRGDGLDGIAGTLTGEGVLLVGKSLLQGGDSPGEQVRSSSLWHTRQGDSLGRGILLLNVAVDEDGDLLRDTVDLILGLGDVQLGQELFEHLQRLLVL